MELQATDTVPLAQDTELPAPGMELQTAPAEGPSVTKIRIRTTRTRTRSRATVMEPLSVTMLRLATSTANPADRATRTEEPSTSLPSSRGVGTRRMTRTRTRPLVMKTGLQLEHEKELKLGKLLLRLGEVMTRMADDLLLHPLCEFMYEVANTFTEFYENCYCVEKDKSGTIVKINWP